MFDPNFEQNVRKRMEELKFTPSDKVWKEISQELNPPSRNRRLIAALILFILIASGLTYWTVFHNANPQTEQQQAVPLVSNDTQQKTVEEKVEGKVQQNQASVVPPASIVTKESLPEKNAPLKQIPANNYDKGLAKNITHPKEAVQQKNVQNHNPLNESIAQENHQVIRSVNTNTPLKAEKILTPSILSLKLNNSFTFNTGSLAPNKLPIIESEQGLIAEKHSGKKKKGWSWGIHPSISRTTLVEGNLLNLEKSMVEDISQNFNGPAMAPSFSFSPSKIEPATGFGLDIYVKRSFSPRVSLTVGLGYTRFSARSETGNRINANRVVMNGPSNLSTINTYFDNGGNLTYTSHYHFVTLPVTAGFTFNPSGKIPVSILGGAAVNKLVATNGLHFDGSQGIYYEDKSLMRNTQFGIHGALMARVVKTSAFDIEIGPGIRYHLSPVLNNSVNDSRKLIGWGFDARINFNK